MSEVDSTPDTTEQQPTSETPTRKVDETQLLAALSRLGQKPVDKDYLIRCAKVLYLCGFDAIPTYGVTDEGWCTCGKVNKETGAEDYKDPDKHPIGKHPIGMGWQERRYSLFSTVRQIKEYEDGIPNLSIRMGLQHSGIRLIAIDDDGKLEDFEDEYGVLPKNTLTMRSGSGGRHLIYAIPKTVKPLNKVRIKSRTKTEPDPKKPGRMRPVRYNVDIRADSGHIVCAPSRHKSGNQYGVVLAVRPLELPEHFIPVLEASAVESTKRAAPASRRIGSASSIVRRAEAYCRDFVSVGGCGLDGHGTLYNAALALFWGFAPDLPENEAERIFRAFNAKAQPPEDEYQVTHKMADARAGKSTDKPRGWLLAEAPVNPLENVYENESRAVNEIETWGNATFPLEVFPEKIREYVLAVAAFLVIDVNLAAMATLGALSIAAQRRLRIEILPHVWQPMVLQIIIFACSGERKSPLFKQVQAPIYDYQRQQRENHAARVTALQGEIALAKRAEDQERVADLERELRELPPPFFTVLQDVTPEMAVRMMADNAESMALVSDDGKLLENFAGRYRSGVDQLDIILKGWDASPYYYARVGAGMKVLESPRLGYLLATQYKHLRDLNDDRKPFRERGAMARILPFVAKPRTEVREPLFGPPVPSALRDEYHRVMTNLMSGAPLDAGLPDESGDVSIGGGFDVFDVEFHDALAREAAATAAANEPRGVEDYSPRILRQTVPLSDGTEACWFHEILRFADRESLPNGSCAGMADWLAKWADNSARAIGLLEFIGGAQTIVGCSRLCAFFLDQAKRALLQPGSAAPEDGTLSERCHELLAKLKAVAAKEGKTRMTCREALRAHRKVGSMEQFVELLEVLDKHNYLTLEEPRGGRRTSKYVIVFHETPKASGGDGAANDG
jgi:hypothetical protein